MIPYDRVEQVVSRNLDTVGTVGDWLIITFKNGDIYRYSGLASWYDDLVNAESIGKYFHQNIRSQSYEKLRDEDWPSD